MFENYSAFEVKHVSDLSALSKKLFFGWISVEVVGGGLLWWGGVRGSSESMYRNFFFFNGG